MNAYQERQLTDKRRQAIHRPAIIFSMGIALLLGACSGRPISSQPESGTCGDGIVDRNEECDGENLGGKDCRSIGYTGGSLICSASCMLDVSGCLALATCGNGFLDSNEECDCGISQDTMPATCHTSNLDEPNADCRSDCTLPRCGDGIVDSAAGEACDDGNLTNSDACPDGVGGTCQPATCGDGIVWIGHEQCDCGASQDTMPATCHTNNSNEPDAECRPDCTLPHCGDGIVDSATGEECDDGNTVPGDGCNAECRIEACGNAVVDVGEGCDDGNHNNHDACLDDVANGGTCQPARCGDGIVWADREQCDCADTEENQPATCMSPNANTPDADCRLDCTVQRCGDAIVDTLHGEECDDGNAINGDGCSAACRIENN